MPIYYTVYEVKNKVNDKIYVGSHKTHNPQDRYMGSGTAIKSAIKKYGVESFTKTILFYLDSEEDMYLKESQIVNDAFIRRDDTYNMTVGGHGSWSHTKGMTNEVRLVLGLPMIKGKPKGCKHSEQAKKERSNRLKGKPVHENLKRTVGIKHSEATKKKLSESAKNRVVNHCKVCARSIKGSMNWDRHLKSNKHLSQLD